MPPIRRRLAMRRLALVAAAAAAGASALPARADGPAESTFDRVRRSKSMRVGVVNGQPPYCARDLASGEWHGLLIDFARDLASSVGAAPAWVESTWGNAALDVQAGKVDIFFGLNPTPNRALVVDFTHPLFNNVFTVLARPGFPAPTWAALDVPETRIAIELGSSYDQVLTEICPRATILRLKSNNDATMAVQARRADCQVLTAMLSLAAMTRAPGIGTVQVPTPLLAATTNAAVPREPDKTWRDFVDTWIDWNRGLGRLRHMVLANLATVGVSEADIPPQVTF